MVQRLGVLVVLLVLGAGSALAQNRYAVTPAPPPSDVTTGREHLFVWVVDTETGRVRLCWYRFGVNPNLDPGVRCTPFSAP
jgi:hypothetical protein